MSVYGSRIKKLDIQKMDMPGRPKGSKVSVFGFKGTNISLPHEVIYNHHSRDITLHRDEMFVAELDAFIYTVEFIPSVIGYWLGNLETDKLHIRSLRHHKLYVKLEVSFDPKISAHDYHMAEIQVHEALRRYAVPVMSDHYRQKANVRSHRRSSHIAV